MMKKNVWTAVSTAMLFLPWTLLLLRMNAWALESPAAETLISCYSAFMIFSGLFTLFAYTKGNVRNSPGRAGCWSTPRLWAACPEVSAV